MRPGKVDSGEDYNRPHILARGRAQRTTRIRTTDGPGKRRSSAPVSTGGKGWCSTRGAAASRRFLEQGSPADLQAILGHAYYATTERYVRAVSDRARDGFEALDMTGTGTGR